MTFVLLQIIFLSVTAFANSIVNVPLRSSADYPFVCYRSAVDTPAGANFLTGRLHRLYFGYTRATVQEFNRNNNVPWYNFRGQPVAEGYVDIEYRHDGGYKGIYNLVPVRILVPAGWNLVYRIAYLKKVGGSCYTTSDPLQWAYSETGVYFAPGN